MESTSKTIAAVMLAVTVLAGCKTAPVVPVLVEAPKPTVDSRILRVCDVSLTPLRSDSIPRDMLTGYAEALTLLNACSCRQREARNALCTLTSPGCEAVTSCEAPK